MLPQKMRCTRLLKKIINPEGTCCIVVCFAFFSKNYDHKKYGNHIERNTKYNAKMEVHLTGFCILPA